MPYIIQAGLLILTEDWSSVQHLTWEEEQTKTHGYYGEPLVYVHWTLKLHSFYFGKDSFFVNRLLNDQKKLRPPKNT